MGILFTWLKGRLTEATTWMGLISIVQGAGLYISPELAQAFVPFAVALVGALLVQRKNNPGPTTPPTP